jgi:radical SAM superfamily enzyme YgiQ (UPF0313 family)
MPKRALLINPPSGMYIRDDRCQVPVKGLSSGLRTPLDLAYMAAVLEKEGIGCVIRDCPAENKTWQDLRKELEGGNFDMLIVSVTTPTLYADLSACDIAKEINPDIMTVAKGAHFAAEDKEVLERFKNLDIAIRGEYELAVRELGRGKPPGEILGITYRADGAIKRNPDRPFLENLDILPLPARHLLNNRLYIRPDTGEMMTSIQTNKGCPARCCYCLVRTVSGSKIITRSPESIASEMEICKKKFGIKNFYFRADTFTWDKDWMIKVCKCIIDKKLDAGWVCNSRVDTIDEDRLRWLKKAGCWMIGFGIESGDQDILNKMRKGTTLQQAVNAIDLCRRFGIKTYLFWVLGLPWETEGSIKNTMRFAKRIKGDFAEFHIAYPFPGTDFYYTGLENNLFSKEDLYKGNVKSGIVRTFTLSEERLQYYQRRITRGYYLSPWRIIRLLKGVHSPKVLLNYIKKGFLVLFDFSGQNKIEEEEDA